MTPLIIREQIEFSYGEAQDISEINRSLSRLYSTGAFARPPVILVDRKHK
jgi:hypothetical protein